MGQEENYLYDYDVERKCKGKKIAIYGCGKDGKEFYRRYSEKLNLVCYIDKTEKDAEIPVKQLERITDELVVVCSRAYCTEIERCLVNMGFKGGKDYYIWVPEYTKYVKEFIFRNKKKCCQETNDSCCELLVPIAGANPDTIVFLSFMATLIARKDSLQMKGYHFLCDDLHDETKYNLDHVTKEVYSSFGVKHVENYVFDKQVKKEAQTLCDNIMSRINSRDDWHNITIDGICFGNAIVEIYLRRFELSSDPRNPFFELSLFRSICYIKWWQKYLDCHHVGTLICWDGTAWDSILRILAYERGIPVYLVNVCQFARLGFECNFGKNVKEYKREFLDLSSFEQQEGVKKAKEALREYIYNGKLDKIKHIDEKLHKTNVYSLEKTGLKIVRKNKNVVICPHIFDESSIIYGTQIFGNYISWLEELGELSKQTNYGWYIKKHPHEGERGNRFINDFLKRYPNIQEIPMRTSPFAMREAGIEYAFTVYGSIGHEYPIVGINVINAGNNPHSAFDFNINPLTREEFYEIVKHIGDYDKLCNIEELYEYYYIDYLKGEILIRNKTLEKILLADEWDAYNCLEPDSTKWYKKFLEVVKLEEYERIYKELDALVKKEDIEFEERNKHG